ncbi:MAG: class I SAM-dependent methyltransferase [Dehalococcoidia bacterium]|nr:class I SAM-dependent methyltransferase [Dehalococcoidia bacterium]
MAPTAETQRLFEYERWHSALTPRALAARFAMSPAGAFLANAPVFQLKENLKLEPWMRTLEVGCGAGSVLRILDERVHFDAPPVGLDFSPTVLRRARGREREGQPEFVLGAATALPFRDGAFDFVTSGYLASHLDDDEVRRFVGEVRRVLAPGGLALLWDYAPTGNPRLDAWNEAVLSRGVRKPHLRSTRALMALGELAGFEYIRPARLRPFLLPPIPRASVLLGRPPAGWSGGGST